MEKIEFIIPTYEDGDNLIGLIYSLINQKNKNWTAHVVADGDYSGFDSIAEHFTHYHNIKFSKIEGPNKDWGHTARNYGLKHSNEEWVVMTGADNYYMPDFVDEFLKTPEINGDYNFTYCNMVHNEAHYKHYQVLETKLKINEIDMGCFATRSKYAKQIKLDTKSYQADWFFVENYRILYPSKVNYINKVLYVHN